jgi:hypothetical protein
MLLYGTDSAIAYKNNEISFNIIIFYDGYAHGTVFSS